MGAGMGGGSERPWAERRQCLLVIIHFTRGSSPRTGCRRPGGLSDGVTCHLRPINNVGRMHKLEWTPRHFTRGEQTARVKSTHAEWQGGEEGREVRGIINSTHSILYPTLGASGRLCSPPAVAVAGSGAGVSQLHSLGDWGGGGVAAWREK